MAPPQARNTGAGSISSGNTNSSMRAAWLYRSCRLNSIAGRDDDSIGSASVWAAAVTSAAMVGGVSARGAFAFARPGGRVLRVLELLAADLRRTVLFFFRAFMTADLPCVHQSGTSCSLDGHCCMGLVPTPRLAKRSSMQQGAGGDAARRWCRL